MFGFFKDLCSNLAELGPDVADFGKSVGEVASCATVGLAEAIVDEIDENPVAATAVIAGTVLTGGMALANAPLIGATVSAAGFGVGGGTLSGAAASSAGLAALGGGSLASGGLGMAGGTAVVTAAGAVTGAAASTAAVDIVKNV